MVSFRTKNPNLGKFWRASEQTMFGRFVAIRNIPQPIGVFHGHLVYFGEIWSLFHRFGTLHQEKSGNRASGYSTGDRSYKLFWSSSPNDA
jgi:hypothetical protein